MSTDLSSITTPHSTLQTPATSILSFSEGSLETIEPSPCTAPCGVAAYHAAGIGPTPSLCDKDETPFISAYENCAACIQVNDGSWEGILKPELQQALAYCDIDFDAQLGSNDDGGDGEDDSSTKSAGESADGSSSGGGAEESGAEETSEPSGEAEGGESEGGDDGGDGDDDSSGSHLAVFGPLLGGVAGLLHFLFI